MTGGPIPELSNLQANIVRGNPEWSHTRYLFFVFDQTSNCQGLRIRTRPSTCVREPLR